MGERLIQAAEGWASDMPALNRANDAVPSHDSGACAADQERERRDRRRRQNRLNQRARRQRQGPTQASQTRAIPPFKTQRWRPDDDDPGAGESRLVARSYTNLDTSTLVSLSHKVGPASWGVMPSDVEYHGWQLQSAIQVASPQADYHLHLIQFNVFRGMFNNKVLLSRLVKFEARIGGIPQQIELLKTFPTETIMISPSATIPSRLQPTDLQKKTMHPTWMDLFPFPRMRESLIRRQAEFNHRDMLKDIMGDIMDELFFREGPSQSPADTTRLRLPSCVTKDASADRKGIVIWGEPHLQQSWEFTVAFWKKWYWLFGYDEEMLQATNFWRMKRGEALLQIPYPQDGERSY